MMGVSTWSLWLIPENQWSIKDHYITGNQQKKTVTDGDFFLPALNTQTGDAPKSSASYEKAEKWHPFEMSKIHQKFLKN